MKTVAVIQARMSSRRFPGKVLAPFRGRPIVAHVVEQLRAALPSLEVVLATSTEPSDDPLAGFAAALGLRVVRGPLDDVLGRFRKVARETGAERLLRICADSPLVSPVALRRVLFAADASPDADLVTTTLRRTFPKGQNAELLSVASIEAIPEAELEAADREHVTRFFHRNASRFQIVNVESNDPSLAALDLAVDTVEDLARLEAMSADELAAVESRAMRSVA